MSVTVYVEGWHEAPEGEYPDDNFGNSNWSAISKALGLSGDDDAVPFEKLGDVAQACVRLMNSKELQAAHVVDPVQEGNLYVGGRDAEYLVRAASRILKIVKFAQDKGAGIYWG